ncbi:MAG TPA: hypothetical protein VJR03_15450 [Nitrospira sp.]|nr:hypothetical protein [Nitrospira sp.]
MLLLAFSGITALAQTATMPEPTTANEQPVCGVTAGPLFHDEHPSVSPNGKVVVFSRQQLRPQKKPTLWMMNLDGTLAHPLTPADFPLGSDYPAWSPTGSVIAFRAGPDMDRGGIWLIDADGTHPRRLTDETRNDDMYPEWSPDGTWMVISRGPITQEPTNHLWQLKLDGALRQLTKGNKYEGKMSVAPDGRRIAFSTDRPDRHMPDTNIWITTLDNAEENARPFTSGGGAAPAWSPDGKWIAFTSNRERGYAVYLRRVTGGPAIRVTAPVSADNSHPAWAPNGRTIVFEQYDAAEHAHIFVVDLSNVVTAP